MLGWILLGVAALGIAVWTKAKTMPSPLTHLTPEARLIDLLNFSPFTLFQGKIYTFTILISGISHVSRAEQIITVQNALAQVVRGQVGQVAWIEDFNIEGSSGKRLVSMFRARQLWTKPMETMSQETALRAMGIQPSPRADLDLQLFSALYNAVGKVAVVFIRGEE